jgi:predicted ATPase
LAQAGEGLQQVLPIVTDQLWRQEAGASYFIDIIEQPELHLHAAAQAPLADLFIDTAIKTSGITLVETNSEGILLRMQRRVAEGKIQPHQIALYFVDNSNEAGSELRRIDVTQSGEISWWPEGVFEEDFSEVAAIRRAQKRRFGQPSA